MTSEAEAASTGPARFCARSSAHRLKLSGQCFRENSVCVNEWVSDSCVVS